MAGEAGGFEGGAGKGGPGAVEAAAVPSGGAIVSAEFIEAERDEASEHDAAEPTDAADLLQRLKQAEADLAEARAELAATARRAAIDAALAAERPVDIETARTMVESVIAEQDVEDVAGAVAALRERKPFLFAAAESVGIRSSAMAAEPVREIGADLDEIAEQARASGDRRELLRYLRTRRGG